MACAAMALIVSCVSVCDVDGGGGAHWSGTEQRQQRRRDSLCECVMSVTSL